MVQGNLKSVSNIKYGHYGLSGLFVVLLALVLSVSFPAYAQDKGNEDSVDLTPPPGLEYFQEIEREDDFVDESTDRIFDIRSEALREAAISLGARGGLAFRTYQIRKTLKSRAANLNKIYDFRQLLIMAPSGLLIEPPIVSEAIDNMIIDSKGTQAAVTDQIYNIGSNARIVSAPRSWNQYLERTFNEVDPPPQLLRPESSDERKKWREWVRLGWENGIEQADEIFETDLARLNAHYEGMIRYRKLLAQGMISAPFALQNDRGITGGGNFMRIGDRSVSLTGMPQLKPGYEEWRPASR